MQQFRTSKYNTLLSCRHEEVIIQNLEGVLQFLCTWSTQKGKDTIVPSAMIDTQSLQTNYRDTFFSIYLVQLSGVQQQYNSDTLIRFPLSIFIQLSLQIVSASTHVVTGQLYYNNTHCSIHVLCQHHVFLHLGSHVLHLDLSRTFYSFCI